MHKLTNNRIYYEFEMKSIRFLNRGCAFLWEAKSDSPLIHVVYTGT